jgi:hypothetical protein
MKSQNDSLIFESPDGGRTVYARKSGETVRTLYREDPVWKREQELTARWNRLKGAVLMDDPTLNDAIERLEVLYALKKKET